MVERSGSQVVKLYTCIVCGKGFSSRAALSGHMRVHGDIVWKRLTVRLPAELVDEFYRIVDKHKTTTCSVIHGLLEAVVKGEELGVVKLQGPNPFIVQLQNFYLSKPRGHGKYDFASLPGFDSIAEEPKCVLCGAPAVVEGVQEDGWRFGLCRLHAWLRRWAPIWRGV